MPLYLYFTELLVKFHEKILTVHQSKRMGLFDFS